MYGCESCIVKKAEHQRTEHQSFWTVVLNKTLESPLDCKEIQPVNPKGNQSWIFTGRTDTETPKVGPPAGKNCLTGKDPDAGKDWRQEEKGKTDEIVGSHHRLDGCEFEQAPGIGDGQGSLVCCSPSGHRVRHDWATELNWNIHITDSLSLQNSITENNKVVKWVQAPNLVLKTWYWTSWNDCFKLLIK